MANRKITLKDSTETDNLYPATFTSQVFNEDGENVDTLLDNLNIKRIRTSVTFETNQYVTPFQSLALISCSSLGISRNQVVGVYPLSAFATSVYFYPDNADYIAIVGRTTNTISVDVLYY